MRLILDRRALRFLARLPSHRWYSVVELGLLAMLGLQSARLLLAIVTPVGPVGDWRIAPAGVAAAIGISTDFDPFFRLASATGGAGGGPGSGIVTGLDLTLFGIRADQASGRGAAIIGLPGGAQQSVAVGEEIMPGVVLKAVAFDHVTLSRGGVDEQLFLDQSSPATIVGSPAAAGGATPVADAGRPVSAAALIAGVQFLPHIGVDGIDGFIVQPRGDGIALTTAGLTAGDVIVSVNGLRVQTAADAARIQQQLGRGGDAAVIVERGGAEVPLAIRIAP